MAVSDRSKPYEGKDNGFSNNILHGEKNETISSKIRNKARVFTLLTLIQYCTGDRGSKMATRLQKQTA
jgi:hypothetical protein